MKGDDFTRPARKRTPARPVEVCIPPNKTEIHETNWGEDGVREYLMRTYGTVNPDRTLSFKVSQ